VQLVLPERERRIVTNWPGYMNEYVRRVRELEPSEFTFQPQPGA
jgi:hypothetical protein